MRRLFLRFPHEATAFGGVDRANHTIADLLSRRFEIVEDPARAELQLCSLDWDAPAAPRRLFIDHGSFADAGFWTYIAPRLRCEDTILVTSRVCEAVAQRLFGEARPLLRRVPLFADTQRFRPVEDRAALRRAVAAAGGPPADGALLLAVGTFSRRKNLHLAVRLLAALRAERVEVRLCIVGRSSPTQAAYRAAVVCLVERLGVASRVSFVEGLAHEQLARLMACADLLVHFTTCRLENFGLVVAEALSAGLPVVGADWGGLRDLVEQGATGALARTWLTDRGPRVDWRRTVEPAAAWLTDRAARERAGRAAVDAARERLGLEPFAARLTAAVESTLDAQAAPGPARLSELGEDVMFATIRLHMARTDLRSAGAEYRALLEREPALVRRLTAPAASSANPPDPAPEDRPYVLEACRVDQGTLEVDDPVWGSDAVTPSPGALQLAARCDGVQDLRRLAATLGLEPEAAREAAVALLEAGVIGLLDGG